MINRRSMFTYIIFYILTGLLFFFSCSPIQFLGDLEGLSTQTPWMDNTPAGDPENPLVLTPELTQNPTPEPTFQNDEFTSLPVYYMDVMELN